MIRRSWMLMFCGLALGLASSVCAQNSNSGDIRGTVTDTSGAVVPGTNVTVTDTDTGVVSKYVTNNDGLYDTNSILPGTYTVEFSKGGYESYKRTGIPLEVGIITVDAQLKVGAATAVVEVNASDIPLLKTEDAQVSTTLTTNELTNLPNTNPSNGYIETAEAASRRYRRDTGATATVAAVIIATPSSIRPSTEPCPTSPAIWSTAARSGCRKRQHRPGHERIRVRTQRDWHRRPSQYGGGGSVFNVILKSGSEQFHGSAYDYIQNDDFNARSYFNNGATRQSEAAFQLLRRGDRRPDHQEQNVLLLQLSTVEKPPQRVQHSYGANCSHEGRLF